MHRCLSVHPPEDQEVDNLINATINADQLSCCNSWTFLVPSKGLKQFMGRNSFTLHPQGWVLLVACGTDGSLLPVLALWRVCLGDFRVLCLSFRMWSTCLLGLLHRFTEGIYRRMILAPGCLRSSPLFTALLLWNIPYALVSMNVTHSCNYWQRTDRFKRTLLGRLAGSVRGARDS